VAYDYFNAYRERELTAAQLEARLAEARLQSLNAQLHPHFLFNTLNGITAFMEKDPKTARLMTAHLGDLLRFSLEHENKQEITLAEDLALLQHYLEIQRIRFADRLTVQMDIAPATLPGLVPSLLLQPLVENAIRHGITPRASSGCIKIRSAQENGMLRLQVRDNGLGLAEGWKPGIGLTNTRERLVQLYNHDHSFTINNTADGGVVVDIALPFRVESNNKTGRLE
jgi:LytS/YehU family sensor histidine kinase